MNTKVIYLIIISSILLLTLCAFIIFLLSWKKKIVLKNLEIEVFRKIEIIKRIPLRFKIFRIANIADKNTFFIKFLVIWRTKYEKFIENMYITNIEKFNKLIQSMSKDKKTEKPSQDVYRKNLNMLLKNFTIIEQESRLMLDEINSSLKVEFLQRNYIVSQKKMFNELLSDLKKFTFMGYMKKESMNNFIFSLQNLFNDFEKNIRVGDFLKNEDLINDINSGLKVFLDILKVIPQSYLFLEKVLPKKIIEAKEMRDEFLADNFKKDYIPLSYDLFKEEINKKVSLLDKYLKAIQYKKVPLIVYEIIVSFYKYINDFSNQKNIMDIFNNYYNMMPDIISYIEKTYTTVINQIEDLKITSSLTSEEEEVLLTCKSDFNNLKAAWSSLSKKMSEKGAVLNYFDLNKELADLFSYIIISYKLIGSVNYFIERRNKYEVDARRKVHHLKITLIQAETRINNVKYSKHLSKYKQEIEFYRNKLEKIKNKYSNLKDVEVFKNFKLDLTEASRDISLLFNSILDNIFMILLAEESLTYAQSHSINSDNYLNAINNAENFYYKGEFDFVIHETLKILNDGRRKG